jgi:membrane-bound lytic murein transglycosylase D
MLKTQFVKATYLCLFCLFTTSFTPRSNANSSNPLLKDGIGSETLSVMEMRSEKTSLAPKVKLNRQALQFANHYIKTSAEDLVDIKQRSGTPFSIMDKVFRRYGLPVELKYLAVIESELKSSALSPVGALGPWQLMPGTAHDLGLQITTQCDERTNYYKSTKAAALYLKDLYAQFGDWLLVLAAYNSGPGPVYAAIQKSGSRNFWALQDYLPAETRGHVKRFIATHYYFEGQGSVTTLTKAENVEYRKSISAFAISRSAAGLAHSTSSPHSTPGPHSAPILHSAPTSQEVIAKANGSQEEQFKRIMNEAEKSLRKANKIIKEVARRQAAPLSQKI